MAKIMSIGGMRPSWTACAREDIVVHAIAIGDADQTASDFRWQVWCPTSFSYHGEPVMSRAADSSLETIALRD